MPGVSAWTAVAEGPDITQWHEIMPFVNIQTKCNDTRTGNDPYTLSLETY